MQADMKQGKNMETVVERKSFTPLFTIISLAIITLITISVSVISVVYLRNISYNSIDLNVQEHMNQLSESLDIRLQNWTTLIQETAVSAAPIMAQEPVDQEALRQLFRRITDSQTDAWHIYGSNNTLWTQPGGWLVYSNGTTPSPTFNNTTRNWFIGAKERPREAAFAEPYIADSTGQLTTAVSTNVYDATGNDIGVVSANVSIAFLSEMLDKNSNIPDEELFFINKDGLYITHPDEQAVLNRSFFSDFGLEQYQDAVLGKETFTTIDTTYYLNSTRIPEANWFLVTMVPTQVIYADTNRLITRFVLLNAALIIIVVTVAAFLIRILRHDRDEIIKVNRLLVADRDEIAAMKDNLKTGIFLMDKDSVIQSNYSRSLEKIFPFTVYKTKFIDILSASFTSHELEIVKDFFDMVRTRARPQNQLDYINPLDELVYTSNETHEVKTLRCRFVPVERVGDTFLLGTVDDITEETQLRKQLNEEAAKRDEEMRSLFEVVHVEPTILMTFAEDTTHGLDESLTLLHETKNGDGNIDAMLVRLYQLIHAIKSDAYIIGLSVYGNKLHNIESELKRLRDRDNSAPKLMPDDLAVITTRLEEIEQEKDKLFNILYLHTSTQKQEELDILMASLKRACEQVAADLGKRVRFEPADVDPEALKAAPYRQLKVILIQLVRNAVYHGIESPGQRNATGKNETGVIRFSLQRQGETTTIASATTALQAQFSHGAVLATIQDDGVGLNFDKIRSKALANGLIAENETGQDKLLKALFQPGFSTAETEGIHAGRGIGLSLVQEEVHALRGSIKVRTKYGKGTAFIISIPLA
jgi:two-component system chemotaxis sensor kinase CheA